VGSLIAWYLPGSSNLKKGIALLEVDSVVRVDSFQVDDVLEVPAHDNVDASDGGKGGKGARAVTAVFVSLRSPTGGPPISYRKGTSDARFEGFADARQTEGWLRG
jgi:hypothetical protein